MTIQFNFQFILKLLNKMMISFLTILTAIGSIMFINNSVNASALDDLQNSDSTYSIKFKDKTPFSAIVSNGLNRANFGATSITGYTVKDGNYLPYKLNIDLIDQNLGFIQSNQIEKTFKENFSNYILTLKEIKNQETISNTNIAKSDILNANSPQSEGADQKFDSFVEKCKENSNKFNSEISCASYDYSVVCDNGECNIKSTQNIKQEVTIDTILDSYSKDNLENSLKTTKSLQFFNDEILYIDSILLIGDELDFKSLESNISNYIDFESQSTVLTNIKKLEQEAINAQNEIEVKINQKLTEAGLETIDLENEFKTDEAVESNPNTLETNLVEEKELIVTPKEEIINSVFEEELGKISDSTLPEISPEQEVLKDITEEQIAMIDNLIVTDAKSNLNIEKNNIEKVEGITTEMATQIKTLIDNQNNIDEIDREINNLEPIMNYSTTNNVTKPNLIDNVSNALFGEVEAEAWDNNCYRWEYWSNKVNYWWGQRFDMSRCSAQRAISYFESLANYLTIYPSTHPIVDYWLGEKVISSGLGWALAAYSSYPWIFQHTANKFRGSTWCNRGIRVFAYRFWLPRYFNRCNWQEI